MTEYYYILSSMPALSLDKRPNEEELDEAIQLILRNLSEKDQESLAWFFRRNDVYNLIEYWQFEFDHLLHRPLRKPYSLSQENLKSLRVSSDQLPFFLREWYQENQDLLPHWSANRIETEVHKLFFEAIEDCEEGFIREYFLFEKELRSIMATYHQSRYTFLDSEPKWLEKGLRQNLQRNPVQLNENLNLEMPFLSGLLKALDTKEPIEITRAVHQVLWDKADELAQAHYYDLRALLNYCAKLFLLYRREQLQDNRKQARLQTLVDEALSNIEKDD